MKHAHDWWKLPSVVAGAVIAVGAIGTGVVKLAAYLTLPQRVEAAEQENTKQTLAINDIAAVLKVQQQMQQQEQAQEEEDWYWCERCGKAGEWREKPPKPKVPPR